MQEIDALWFFLDKKSLLKYMFYKELFFFDTFFRHNISLVCSKLLAAMLQKHYLRKKFKQSIISTFWDILKADKNE